MKRVSVKASFGFIVFLAFCYTGFAQVNTCVDVLYTKNVSGALNGVSDYSCRWNNGSVLKVKFTGGDAYVISKVKKYAVMWEDYANISFQFVETGTPDILVSFVMGDGSWSYVGTDAKDVIAAGRASMNYGWFDKDTDEDEFQRTILHEFGHALGLLHEHRNANNDIQWNLPVVYNYYQKMGWSVDQVNDQVLGKYSVTLSNHTYDPKSIMHYPIPKEHTLNGYSVGWNRELSSGDISLISDMYPKPSGPVIVDVDTVDSESIASATLQEITIEHNVYKDGQKGMKIYVDFTISDAKGKNCMLAAYFYDKDGTALPDENDLYASTDGKVALGVYVTPSYSSSKFTDKEMFFPYDELHQTGGEHKLKFEISLWDEEFNEIAQSGSYYFDYSKGIVCNEVESLVEYDEENNRIIVMPKFTVKNAKGVDCQACVFFYYEDGSELAGPDGEQLYQCQSFTPAYTSTWYNNSYYSDLYLYIPYESINIPEGTHNIMYYVALYSDDLDAPFATSDWVTATFSR